MIQPYWTSSDGRHRVYCGDTREIHHELLRTDVIDYSRLVVITDPPYGIKFASHGQCFRDSDSIAGDESTDCYEWLTYGRFQDIPMAAFFSPYKPITGWRNVLAWAKGAHVGIGGDRETCWKRDFELIGVRNNRALNGQRDSAVLRFNAVSPPPTGHFAEKPIELMVYLVEKLSQPDDIILDPFMGSGTTGAASERCGRRFVGIEIERRWCDVAIERIEEAMQTLWRKDEPKDVQLEFGVQ